MTASSEEVLKPKASVSCCVSVLSLSLKVYEIIPPFSAGNAYVTASIDTTPKQNVTYMQCNYVKTECDKYKYILLCIKISREFFGAHHFLNLLF